MSRSAHRTERATAEALFGSSARGDTDAMSDRDILVVDDDVVRLRKREAALSHAGWSVASYTFAKLEALAAKGALFIQHLKLEAKILFDDNDRLGKILDEFRPRTSYTLELLENSHLAMLAETVPNGRIGPLLAADILYVALRNFGVLSLAERGIHLYSFRDILVALEGEGLLRIGATHALLPLRSIKCAYRGSESSSLNDELFLLNNSLAYLPEGKFPSRVDLVAPRSILAAAPPVGSDFAYLLLRDLEKRFVAIKQIDPTILHDSELQKLSRWIANPRTYSRWSSQNACRLRGVMGDKIRRLLEDEGAHKLAA